MVKELNARTPVRQDATHRDERANRYCIPVVLNTFRILDELAKADGLALSELTQKTGVAKSTVFRVLSTLLHLGFVLRRRGRYSVTTRLANLANEQAKSETIRRVALPFMLRLRDQFGETINLGMLRLDKVEYIEVVPSESALRFSEKAGTTVHVHASALGKILLAYADKDYAQSLIGHRTLPTLTRNTIKDPATLIAEIAIARQRGFAVDKGETSSEAFCVAAPILGKDDAVVAALSISGPISRFAPRKDDPVIKKLQSTAKEISRQLTLSIDFTRKRAKQARPPIP